MWACAQLAKTLTSCDILLGLVAAATHDLDHPGVNQPFLIKTDHYLAALYKVRVPQTSSSECQSNQCEHVNIFNNSCKHLELGAIQKHIICQTVFEVLSMVLQNTSVLENHHWKSAVALLRESALLSHLPAEDR